MQHSTRTHEKNEVGLFEALLPLTMLIISLVTTVAVYGDDTTGGPAQIALLCSGMLTAFIGLHKGHAWKSLEHAAVQAISNAMVPILILLMVGALIGVWIASGVIPTIIYYGSMILAPSTFYLASLLLCSVISIAVGSSWTTIGTIGIALISIASAMDLSLEITAGAIVSGSYFGDKLSPLSDTTNLAAGLSETKLFTHILFLLWTTIPAFLLALIFFAAAGISVADVAPTDKMDALRITLANKFTISLFLCIPLVCLFLMAIRGTPPLLAIFLSICIAALIGILLQPQSQPSENIFDSAGEYFNVYWTAAASGHEFKSPDNILDDLLSRGGMSTMLPTVWLIISAMFFSGMMERTGSTRRLLIALIAFCKKDGHLISSAGATALAANVVASDQYMSIVLTSRMYAEEFQRKGLDPANLSRVVEDNGTVTSALVPWNTCGAFIAGTLGVGTLAYLPYCIFNIVSPIISHIYAAIGFRIVRIDADEVEKAS